MQAQPTLILKCNWCKTSYIYKTVRNCTNCGGILEAEIKDDGLAYRPKDAPRALPAPFIKRIKYSDNYKVKFGVFLTFVFCWTFILPFVGIFLWIAGRNKALNRLDVLENGKVALGTITNISLDKSLRFNGICPLYIEFFFYSGNKLCTGRATGIFMDVSNYKKVGDKIWIVYSEDSTEDSEIWPPLSAYNAMI